nr:dUTP diphosphatase [Thalassobacillus pellis]
MEWKSLFAMQEKLDRYIEEKQQLEDHDLFDRKVMALLVELGELANETRCFKFWSKKKASEKSVILEEYVDGLHFILSLGLELGVRYEPKSVKDGEDLTTEFHNTFENIVAFKTNASEHYYQEMFNQFLKLGMGLGFSEHDIVKAYCDKNNVNYERQDTGY